MNENKLTGVVATALVTSLVVSLAVSYFQPTANVTIDEGAVALNVDSSDLGAISGNSVDGNTFSIGGKMFYHVSVGMSRGTSTVCALRGPTSTSTLVSAEASFASATPSGSAPVEGIFSFFKGVGNLLATTAVQRIAYQELPLLWQTGIFTVSNQSATVTSPFLDTGNIQQGATSSNVIAEFRDITGEKGLFNGTGVCEGTWQVYNDI